MTTFLAPPYNIQYNLLKMNLQLLTAFSPQAATIAAALDYLPSSAPVPFGASGSAH